jgi:hypothetical protein
MGQLLTDGTVYRLLLTMLLVNTSNNFLIFSIQGRSSRVSLGKHP